MTHGMSSVLPFRSARAWQRGEHGGSSSHALQLPSTPPSHGQREPGNRLWAWGAHRRHGCPQREGAGAGQDGVVTPGRVWGCRAAPAAQPGPLQPQKSPNPGTGTFWSAARSGLPGLNSRMGSLVTWMAGRCCHLRLGQEHDRRCNPSAPSFPPLPSIPGTPQSRPNQPCSIPPAGWGCQNRELSLDLARSPPSPLLAREKALGKAFLRDEAQGELRIDAGCSNIPTLRWLLAKSSGQKPAWHL